MAMIPPSDVYTTPCVSFFSFPFFLWAHVGIKMKGGRDGEATKGGTAPPLSYPPKKKRKEEAKRRGRRGSAIPIV